MRLSVLAALLLLAACATTPDSGPRLRYADAASRGAFASLLAGRPNQAQVERATEAWSLALSDSFGCRVPVSDVINAGLVGALEIAAMNAAATGGGEREVREGVGRYVATLAGLAVQRRAPPPPRRCEALNSWAPAIAADGRDAVERARRNGLMEEDYGLLLGLLGR